MLVALLASLTLVPRLLSLLKPYKVQFFFLKNTKNGKKIKGDNDNIKKSLKNDLILD